MSRNHKLFRAIIVMGAAMTATACGDSKCAACRAVDASPDTVAQSDGAVDAGVDSTPSDAPVDVVLIL